MHVSPSQIDLFKSCNRKWGFAYIDGIKIQKPSQTIGVRVHELLERYLLFDKIPDSNEYIRPSENSREYAVGEIALNGIGQLPAKNSLLEILGVEENFSFRINKIKYVGVIDFIWTHKNESYLHIWDHKTSANPDKWGKISDQLIFDTQAIIYSYYMFRKYQWLDELEFSLNYIDTFHNKNRGYVVTVRLSRDYVEKFMYNKIHPIAAKIINFRTCNIDPNKLDINIETCNAYGGCPYRNNQCQLSFRDKLRSMENG